MNHHDVTISVKGHFTHEELTEVAIKSLDTFLSEAHHYDPKAALLSVAVQETKHA